MTELIESMNYNQYTFNCNNLILGNINTIIINDYSYQMIEQLQSDSEID